MKRRILFIALAIALPLALLIPLRAARSWQPRVLQLPRNTNATGILNSDTNALFWSPQGLLLSQTLSDSWNEPRSITNWNGAIIPMRGLRAQNAALDASGQWAALIYENSTTFNKGKEEFDIWNVPDESSRFDAAKRINAARAQSSGQLAAVAISPDGKRVAFNQFHPDKAAVVGIADTKNGELIARVAHQKVVLPPRRSFTENTTKNAQYFEVSALAWSPDNRQLAVVGINLVRIVDAATGSVVRSWKKPFAIPTSAVWSPDGRQLALARGNSDFPFLWIHDVQSGAVTRSWSQTIQSTGPSGVTNLSWAPDSATLAWGTTDGQVLLMNLASGAIEKRFSRAKPGAINPAQFVAYAPDGRSLAVASESEIALWRTR